MLLAQDKRSLIAHHNGYAQESGTRWEGASSIKIDKTYNNDDVFVYALNGNVTKLLGDYLLNIYRQQKFTFKLTIEFSFLRIKVETEDKDMTVEFDLRLASTNTRPEGFKKIPL